MTSETPEEAPPEEAPPEEAPPEEAPRSDRGRLRRAVFGIGLVLLSAAAVALGILSTRERAVQRAADGTLCASCHEDTGHPLTHEATRCGACHTMDDSLAFDLWRASLGLGGADPHGSVDPQTCRGCHAPSSEEASAGEGHAGHEDAGLGCGACHGDPHEEAAPVQCASCHAEVERHGAAAGTACTTCHRFSASTSFDLAGAGSVGVQGVEGAEVGPGNVHGAMDCRRCHDPHREDRPPVECEGCHRGHLVAEQRAAPPGHRDCLGCHQPHAPRDRIATDCLTCHTVGEHGQGWGVREGEAADIDAERQRLTHDGRCGTCHEPHSWVASESRCAECHESEATTLAALEGAHDGCLSCHDAHQPRPTAAVCTSCHTSVHAGGPAAHRDCLSCHDAHEGRPVAANVCGTCHREAHAQARTSAVAHRQCESCHAVHGAPRRPAGGECGHCHADPASTFARARAPSAHRCAACHQPHAFASGDRALRRCTGCHADVVGAHATHRGTCTQCHDAHGAPAGRASECGRCHADPRPTVTGHDECVSCHQPHHAAAQALAECRRCHAVESRRARTWPAGTPHAGRCAECHRPHAEDRTATCQSCHGRQSNRMHTGGHERCVDCHAPHGVRPTGRRGWWSACTSCHEEESRRVAAATGTHGDCSACHASPGPPLPTCASCHANATRQLSHRAHAQEPCQTCHVTHGTRAVDRATCLSCHEEQRRHFPDAPRCQACHPFAH